MCMLQVIEFVTWSFSPQMSLWIGFYTKCTNFARIIPNTHGMTHTNISIPGDGQKETVSLHRNSEAEGEIKVYITETLFFSFWCILLTSITRIPRILWKLLWMPGVRELSWIKENLLGSHFWKAKLPGKEHWAQSRWKQWPLEPLPKA